VVRADIFLPGLAIAEVKQPRLDRRSEFVAQMRHPGQRPSAISKYVCAFCFQNSNTIGSSLCLGGLTRFCGGATIFADTTNFIIGAVANLAVAIVIVRYIYYPLTQNKNYVFTFLAFNTIIYFVMSSLTSVEIGIGVSLGLLAIFGVLRYRTDPIPIRKMTYLFIVIALYR
jgi:hypothetical protein